MDKRDYQILGAIAGLISVFVLLGWALKQPLLTGGLFNPSDTMKANTAFCFVLSGLALWLLPTGESAPQRRWLVRVAASALLVIALLTLSQHLFGWDLKIDQALFQDAARSPIGAPGRMSFNTNLNFVLVGVALWLLAQGSHRAIILAQGLSLAIAAMTAIAIGNYVFTVDLFQQLTNHLSFMAVPTAISFCLVSLAILQVYPQVGLVQPIFSPVMGWSHGAPPAALGNFGALAAQLANFY